MVKFSEQERKAAVAAYEQGSTISELAQKYSVTKRCIYIWIKRYSVKKIQREKYPAEVQQNIARLYESGLKITELAKRFDISESLIYRYLNKYRDQLNCRLNQEVRQRHNNARMQNIENQIFKLSRCSKNSSIDEKIQAVDRLKEQFGIFRLCKTLELDKSTYYSRLRHHDGVVATEEEDAMFSAKIKELFEQSKQRFGSRKIQAKLKAAGYAISQKRISRLMAQMGLVCNPMRVRYASTSSRKYKYYRNKLKQQFFQKEPNKVWASDITYVRIKEDFWAICVILDLFSRKVISWTAAGQSDTALVLNCFDQAYTKRKKPKGLMFHSDQGCQYTSYAFRSYLRDLGVQQSMSSPGSPHDNAVVESFFACMKREELSLKYYESAEELETDVAEFVQYYNELRPHQRLGFKTPNEIEMQFSIC